MELGRTSADVTEIAVLKTQNLYYGRDPNLGKDTYTDAITSSIAVGCYHIQIPGSYSAYEDAAADAALAGLAPEAVAGVATIDLKKDEAGLLAFCARRGLPLTTYSAEALAAVAGDFTPSAFVRGITGVDNVCERAAVKGSGGALLAPKYAKNGVTLALALCPFAPEF